ncbi:hypothetical protein ACFL5Q_02420 [Planctomycetota bacterium]
MLGKVLGLVTAGVFTGAAALELSGLLSRRRPDKETPERQATDKDAEDAKVDDETASEAQG